MIEWIPGDYVKSNEGRIYQIVRVHGNALYLEDILATTRVIWPQHHVHHITPKETAKALVEAWLSSDFFAMD